MKLFSVKKGGISILGILVFAVVAILVLSYFGINVRDVAESPSGQQNIHYIGGESENIWNAYLKQPADYFYQNIWLPIFWHPFISTIESANPMTKLMSK